MGVMTFLLPDGVSAEARRELERACIAGGPDNMPTPTDVAVSATQMRTSRSVDESGWLVAPWEIDGVGRVMGTTATLMERPRPYTLLVELARIVHGADISEDADHTKESPGLSAIARGFALLHGEDDHEKIRLETPMYDALYAWCHSRVAARN